MRFLTALLLVVSFIYSASAQDFEKKETSQDLGIEFVYPVSWKPTPKKDGYILGSEKLEGFILIRVESYKSIKKMKEVMDNGIVQEDGSKLSLVNELQPMGEDGLAGMYEGSIDEKNVRGFMMGKLDKKSGKGVVIIVVAPQERFNQSHMDALKTIARTLTFI
ncbi:MAG: hypothetical protein KDC58_07735 [Cyclobacteriaceae bacterium]|nr:hypothetical protein [Cyclobacteriaceae bacterium]